MSVKRFLLLPLLLSVVGCSTQGKLYWRAKDFVLGRGPTVGLEDINAQVVLTIPTRTLQEITLAHLRINRAAKIQSELYLVEGDDANAFATYVNGQRVVGINLGMVKMLESNISEYAALLGHEAGHWAKGHVDSATRTHTLRAIGTLVGVGLSAAGVPAAGLISGLGADLIESVYSRDQEREADAQSIEYMLASDYDPWGAIRLQEKLLNNKGWGFRLPFLSSHPSNEERIQNLKALIAATNSAQP